MGERGLALEAGRSRRMPCCGRLSNSRAMRCRSSQSSNSARIRSQYCGEMPNTLSMRSAISGEMGERPLRIMFNRGADTPIALESSAWVRCIPSTSFSFRTWPGGEGKPESRSSCLPFGTISISASLAKWNEKGAALSGPPFNPGASLML